ncbi:MAG: DEAD/DEAH box helicase, partial [Cyanobacteria bacterium]|nr:DEAD/DEAH box helicase [Cyanobacteriota bacterium]
MSKRTETQPTQKTKPPKKPSPKTSKTAPSFPTVTLLRKWFESKGWEAKVFQEEAWQAYSAGKSGMIHVPTGAGKTYAAYLAALVEIIQTQATGLQILFITPLRALSRDIELALTHPAQELLEIFAKTSEPKKPAPAFKVSVESRTGDTNASTRARQKRKMPQVLITTPESLSVMLSGSEAATAFSTLKLVIVDEWHELLSTKRGTLLELSLSRLRMFTPDLITWALSATLVNLEEAAQAAVGMNVTPVLIQHNSPREIVLETLLPQDINTFPWSGHLGLAMLEPLLQKLEEGLKAQSSMLLFTNTRAQAERWFFSLSEARPEWSSILALHHGSLEREVREQVEGGLKSGDLKIVVCTSTLDLGVDFSPVDWVFQIGSPKGIARMIQRAGRSGHRPGATCRIICVPTHAFELVEIAATRKAMAERRIEARHPFQNPFDVLSQHLITCALGGGLNPETMYLAIQKTYSYQTLSKEAFEWVMQFIRQGGECLKAYPDYHKIHLTDTGLYEVTENHIARLHRMNIGTITSSASIQICFLKGNSLGFVEESFISKLKKGDRFGFSGRVLEFVQLRESKAYVKLAKGKPTSIPSWQGGRLPLSTTLSASVREI